MNDNQDNNQDSPNSETLKWVLLLLFGVIVKLPAALLFAIFVLFDNSTSFSKMSEGMKGSWIDLLIWLLSAGFWVGCFYLYNQVCA